MNRERANKIIEILESFRKHVPMYIGKVDVDLTIAWLHGLQAGLAIYGYDERGLFVREKVLNRRGWECNAWHCSAQMMKRGMTPEAIIDETLIIEIEVWKYVAEQCSPRQGWEEAFQAMAEAGDDRLLD